MFILNPVCVGIVAKTGKTTEHSFRGALAALLDALAPGLRAVNEPKRVECGAPDYFRYFRRELAALEPPIDTPEAFKSALRARTNRISRKKSH